MAFDVCYNRETTSHKALYFHNPDELIHLLNVSGKSKLEEVGKAMYESACVRYVWKNIADKYNKEIMKLCNVPVIELAKNGYPVLQEELAA